MKRLGILLVVSCLLIGCTPNIKDGVTLLEEAKYEEAIAAFQVDVKEKKNLDEAYRGIGIAYFELGKYEEAAEAFEKALKNDAKETAILHSFLGACYVKSESYEEALKHYGQALEMKDCEESLAQEIRFNQIAVYEKTGEWDIVKEKVDEYVKLYPDDTSIQKTVEFLETR